MLELEKLVLPAGWEAAFYPGDSDCVVLTRYGKDGGCVTIDSHRRIYALGYGQPRFAAGAEKYAGRGWYQRIVDDAAKHLNDVMEKE